MGIYRSMSFIISYIFILFFMMLFVPNRYSKKKSFSICLLSLLLFFLINIIRVFYFRENDFAYVIATIIQIIVIQSTCFILSKKRDSKVLFTGLTASNYVMAGSVIGNIVFIYTKNIVLSLVISFIVHMSVLLFLVKKIRRIYLIFLEKEEMGSWLQLCLIPAFYYCTFTFLIYFPHTLYENDDNAIGIIFLLITMFISYVVVFRYGENEMKRNDMYMKNILFEYYIKGLESQYDFVENTERNVKILRHDMRHYIGMIDYLLEQKKYDEIKKITEHVNAVIEENKVVKYCDNLRVNTIISNLMKRASSFDIDVHIDAVIPEQIPVNDYELASVAANLLENSLMYVKGLEKKKRYVNMMIHYEDKSLSLKIENECEEEIIFDDVTGLPVSKKGNGHGYGMQSISAFSDKIGGSLGCYCEKGIFTVMLFAKNLI